MEQTVPILALTEGKKEGTGRTRTADRDFADLCLTTWRRCPANFRKQKKWSGRRGSNPRLQPWQGCTLPLSYSRASFHLITLVQPLYFLGRFCQILFFQEPGLASIQNPLQVFVVPMQHDEGHDDG
jgi:hypothetical protein